MSAQLKEGARGDLFVEGFEKASTSHAPVNASSEWVAASVDKRFFVATRPMRVKSIHATVTVAGTDGSAVTAVVRKVPSGTAITGGTVLHTGSINLKGTADTDQTVTLSTTATDLDLATGDALAIDFTGTLTSATGVVSVGMSWR